MSAKEHTVTYVEGPSGSVEVDSKVLVKDVPTPGVSEGQLKRLRDLEGHKFTATEKKEND